MTALEPYRPVRKQRQMKRPRGREQSEGAQLSSACPALVLQAIRSTMFLAAPTPSRLQRRHSAGRQRSN